MIDRMEDGTEVPEDYVIPVTPLLCWNNVDHKGGRCTCPMTAARKLQLIRMKQQEREVELSWSERTE